MLTVPLAARLGETFAGFGARVLCEAVVAGKLAEVRRALDGGADPNALVAVQGAGGTGTALVQAAANGQLEAAALLLDHGASPDKPDSKGYTPLMAAAATDHAAVVGLLAERGADLHATDPEGFTAFHFACANNQTGCVAVLVRAGCDMTAKTKDGQTGKVLAERLGHTDVLECLRDLVAKRLGEASRGDSTANLLVPCLL